MPLPAASSGADPATKALAPAGLLRWLCFACGWLLVLLGSIGLFLPVLPTTPFVLLAVWCFSKSSPRFHAWLLCHKTFGPSLRDWFEHGVIRTRTKLLAIGALSAALAWPVFLIPISAWARWSMVAVWIGLSLFLATRPAAAPLQRPR